MKDQTKATGRDAVELVGWARTPFGRFGGALRDVRLPVLGAIPVAESVRRAGLTPDAVDEVVIGVNFPGSERSVARQVALRAGIPEDRVAFTVDRACCSSLTAVAMASRGLRLGEASVAVAGGVENLSRVPFFLEHLRFGRRLGNVMLTDHLLISCPHTGAARAVQAADEAASFGVDREQQDSWALRSQERYQAALRAGFFDSQIMPTATEDANGAAVHLAQDEAPRPGTSMASLRTLPTVNGSSTVTAGNAPNLSTGAAALVLSDGRVRHQRQEGNGPRVTLEAWSLVSGEPARIASIPARAAQRAMDRAGLTIRSVDIFEVNEAFAAVPLVTALVLADGDASIAADILDRTNVNGGAIAVGHPTGATGARMVMTAAEELIKRGGGVGVVAICGGVGEGESVVVRVS